MIETRTPSQKIRASEEHLKNNTLPAYIYHLLSLQLQITLGIKKKSSFSVFSGPTEKQSFDYPSLLEYLPRLDKQLQDNIQNAIELGKTALEENEKSHSAMTLRLESLKTKLTTVQEKKTSNKSTIKTDIETDIETQANTLYMLQDRIDYLKKSLAGEAYYQVGPTSHYYAFSQLKILTTEHLAMLPDSKQEPEKTVQAMIDFFKKDTFKEAVAQQFKVHAKEFDAIFAHLLKTKTDFRTYYETHFKPLGIDFSDYIETLANYVLSHKGSIRSPLQKVQELHNLLDSKEMITVQQHLQENTSINQQDKDYLKIHRLFHSRDPVNPAAPDFNQLQADFKVYQRACEGTPTKETLEIRTMIVTMVLENPFALLDNQPGCVRELFEHAALKHTEDYYLEDRAAILKNHPSLADSAKLYDQFMLDLIKLENTYKKRLKTSEELTKQKRETHKINALLLIRQAFESNKFEGLRDRITESCPSALQRGLLGQNEVEKLLVRIETSMQQHVDVAEAKETSEPSVPYQYATELPHYFSQSRSSSKGTTSTPSSSNSISSSTSTSSKPPVLKPGS